MGVVMAMFIITAMYVGFHAADDKPEKDYSDGHNIEQELEIFNNNDFIQTMQLSSYSKSII